MFRAVLVVSLAVFLGGCGPDSGKKPKVVAGSMTSSDICSVMGLLIRQKLGSNVKTVNMPCRFVSSGGGVVVMSSAYKPPIGGKRIDYVVKGFADGNRFTIHEIKASGIDDDFVLFSRW
jgi:hypothetical protein